MRHAGCAAHIRQFPTRRQRRELIAFFCAIAGWATAEPARVLHAQVPSARPAPAVDTLPVLVAEAAGSGCAAADDPRARVVWNVVRSRYAADGQSASLWTEMAVYGGWVPAAHLADYDTTSTLRQDGTTEGWTSEEVARDSLRRLLRFYRSPRTGAGARGMAGRMRETLVREIAAQGYARLLPTKFTDISQVWEAWAYPPLDGELASHFIDPVFAARNNLRLVTEGGERLLLFCGKLRFRQQPYIAGALVLRADTTLGRARWRFRTPAPDEEAGGEVEFGNYDSSLGLPHLLPTVATYHRRRSLLYFHRKQVFTRWQVGERVALPSHLVRDDAPYTGPVHVRYHYPGQSDRTGPL